MPIPMPNLDDRRFADLVDELRALIPRYCPEWTDHNFSDPGITLIELFAFVAETLIYRADRVPEASHWCFLQLLGPSLSIDPTTVSLDDARAGVIADLKGRWRAITTEDFEALVTNQFSSSIARTRCLADMVLDGERIEQNRAGHVSVIIVPDPDVVPNTDEQKPFPPPTLLEEVKEFLDERRLITCRVHVVGPSYTCVAIDAVVQSSPGVDPSQLEDLENRVQQALSDFFQPVHPDGGGWPFGRDVYVSEVSALLEGVTGVDHVKSLSLRESRDDHYWSEPRDRIEIPPNNLVFFDSAASTIKAVPPR